MIHERKRVAYHEAGHAVAQLRFDACPGIATIIPKEGDYQGVVHGDFPSEDGLLICCYAGFAADVECGGEVASARSIARGDFDHARDLVEEHDEAACIADARAFVRKNWSAVELIAAELLERETLDFDELAILVEIADGESSADDLARFRAVRAHFRNEAS